MSDSFPRQYARTQRLTLGEPRNLVVAADGRHVLFARSRAGDDPVNCLWALDPATGRERLLVDPLELLGAADDEQLPAAERARRERMREGAAGITSYATDAAADRIAFALAGRLFTLRAGPAAEPPADHGVVTELAVTGPVFDPRPDPTGSRIAYVCGTALRIAELADFADLADLGRADATHRTLADDDRPEVSWGSAEFIAAEEMDRYRGYWWSPDGTAIAACRVDNAPVRQWHIANPADPAALPNVIRYPAAGTPNAGVSLHVLRLDGTRIEVEWNRDTHPYLATVQWPSDDRLLLSVQSRDQRSLQVLVADPRTGATTAMATDTDDAWVELVPGTPATLGDGRLVVCADRDGARRLLVDGTPVTPADLQVRSVAAVSGSTIWFHANPIDDATVQHVWRWDGTVHSLTSEPGVHTATAAGSTVVVRSAVLHRPGATTTVLGGNTITSFAATPLTKPHVTLLRCGATRLATAVLLPHDHDGTPLPVLMDPYGGPHALRALQQYNGFCASQWFADQGFAVVVADGRGTPGRGSEWERSVLHDLASPALDDQVEALHAAAEHHPLDLNRVAIRGWSFGGYLAALAVLRRPDVFHAAVAGAPVTEWRLYDTHYTERYLGNPEVDPLPYDRSSLLPLAPQLSRPLLLVHGLADDNVVAAHTLQLSNALLAAGKPHEVLPLVGVTHMTPQEVVAENLLLHQIEFLRRALGLRPH